MAVVIVVVGIRFMLPSQRKSVVASAESYLGVIPNALTTTSGVGVLVACPQMMFMLCDGGHGGDSVNHQENGSTQRRQPISAFRVGRSRRRIRTNARGNTMAHAQAMAGGANVQRVAIPPAGPVNPLAGNGAIANAGAPPARAPALQRFNIDAALLGPPLRRTQIGPSFLRGSLGVVAPPAVAPATLQDFDIDAALSGPPLRKSQFEPIFALKPLSW